MKFKFPELQVVIGWIWTCGLVLAFGVGYLTVDRWWPVTQVWVQGMITGHKTGPALDEHDHAGHGDGDHGHAHDEENSLVLSRQAMGNIGLTAESLKPVELETFRRTITVPAIVVERPGRTRLEVSTPMAGVITHVHAVKGEAVPPGSLLFEIRITAEELVTTQTALLRTIGDLDVENREIARLSSLAESGSLPQRTLLERQYARDKLEVLLSAQKEALRLQGLSERQISEIITNRRLLRDLKIVAPAPDDHDHHEELKLTGQSLIPIAYLQENQTYADEPQGTSAARDQSASHDRPVQLILQDVLVHKGETVAAGTTLAVVSDMSELYIEGRAFEQDAELLAVAAERDWPVSGVFERAGGRTETVSELELLYSSSQVDPESRTLKFYVKLPNQILRSVPSPNGLRYVEWKYRPGQRLQLRVPVEEWERQIVLPVNAIAQEGAEAFVFQQNGGRFERIPVRVIYRDQANVVIKNDGSIFPGDVIARRGAHQMQMALKNKSGGGVDPHAGHNH